MPLFKILILNLPLFLCSTVTALTFTQPEINDGFASRTFWSITQDHNKYIWMATTHNVLKYDGYEFEALDIPEKNHYKKRTLHIDSAGDLWIGTQYGEVYKYHKGHVQALGLINGLPEIEKIDNQLQINQIRSKQQHLFRHQQWAIYQTCCSQQF